MKLAIFKPYPDGSITQGFGGNANPLYVSTGLKGHPGIDYNAAWGAPIYNCIENSYVYATRNKDNPDLMQYRAVCTLWDDPNSLFSFEAVYGHCSDIQVQVGTYPKVGMQIASIGNTGDVYTHGIEVSALEKKNGSKEGSHLHFQLRQCLRVKQTKTTKQYLYDGNGLLKRGEYYYEVVSYDNFYNGCVDPKPFFRKELAKDYSQTVSAYQNLISILQQMVGLLSIKNK